MKKYTVILVYPDYMCDAGDHQTWCGSVEAENVPDAVSAAQKQVMDDNMTDAMDPDDFLPISVFEGEHDDLIGQWVRRVNT